MFESGSILKLELRKSLWVYTYNSNAIEWNSISLLETKLLLEDWITVWWKTIRELNDIINQNLEDYIRMIDYEA